MEKQRTRWEERERAGLIALETDEWRDKRAAAEDPTTPAETLAQLADEASATRHDGWSGHTPDERDPAWRKCDPLLEAICAHPNTPPTTFRRLCGATSSITGGLCRNPVVPFLLLEQPDFLAKLGEAQQMGLLKRSDAPPLFVRLLAEGDAARSMETRKLAQMHVAVAGEVGSITEGRAQITAYWQKECARAEGDDREWHIDLAEAGLAPDWAMGVPPIPAPRVYQAFCDPLEAWLRWTPTPDSQEERSFLRRLDPQLRNRKLLARALRLSATPDDLRELLRDPAYATFDISEIIRRAVMRHPSVTGAIIQEIYEKALKYAPDVVVLPKTPTPVLTHLLEHEEPVVRRLARKHPNAPPNAAEISRAAVVDLAQQKKRLSAFVSFVSALHVSLGDTENFGNLPHRAENISWTRRLEAVLLARATDAPLSGDPYARTGLDLLHHLARDGNRLVRSIAQTRLADPSWRFAWHDSEVEKALNSQCA